MPLAAVDGRHARAVAQMGDDHPAVGRFLARHFLQLVHDVLVRQAVKAVAAHPLVPKTPGQRNPLRHLGHLPVEGRVETGDLPKRRIVPLHGENGLQLVRQVLGRQANHRFERRPGDRR